VLNIEKMKTKYNEILKRQKKAELYLDNEEIKMVIIEKTYIPEYNKIVKELSLLLNAIRIYSPEEALEGFITKGGANEQVQF